MEKNITKIYLKSLIFSASPDFDAIGKFSGMEMRFYAKDSDQIYTKSYLKKFEVASGFSAIKLKFNSNQFLKFASTVVEGVSSYLYNIRYNLVGEEHLETFIKLTPDQNGRNNYLLKITNNRTKTRKDKKADDKETAMSRYKLLLTIHTYNENNEPEELVELRFTKRDCLLILNSLRSLVSNTDRMFNFAASSSSTVDSDSDFVGTEVVSVSKIDNSIAFGNVFLHGQELLNLSFLVTELVESFGIENNLETMFSNYRQVAVKPLTDYLLGLEISKMKVDKNLHTNEEAHSFDENAHTQRLAINNRLLTGLYLFLTTTQLRHSVFLDQKKDEASFGKKVLYHINLKESNIAIAFTKKPERKISKKTGDSFMNFFSIAVSSKQSMHEQDKPGYIKHFLQNSDEPMYVPVIDKIALNLNASWVSFLETLVRATNREFAENETVIKKRVNIFSNEPGTRIKYSISIYADNDNKAPVVLSIEKYEGEKEILVGKIRQPLFKKHLKQLLILAMQSARELPEFTFDKQKDLKDILSVKYKASKGGNILPISDGNYVNIGIKKTTDSDVLIGRIFDKKAFSNLEYDDVLMLNSSCANRILHGSWLPFVGEKISMSQDGHLTDLFSEVNLEERGQGAFNAWQYFFGTAI